MQNNLTLDDYIDECSTIVPTVKMSRPYRISKLLQRLLSVNDNFARGGGQLALGRPTDDRQFTSFVAIALLWLSASSGGTIGPRLHWRILTVNSRVTPLCSVCVAHELFKSWASSKQVEAALDRRFANSCDIDDTRNEELCFIVVSLIFTHK